jgi:hypothetical protein
VTTKIGEPTLVEVVPGRRICVAGLADWLLALVVGLSVLAVHDVGYILRAPFWVDEAWVAASVRAPLGLAGSLTSSSPIGFTLLLRLVPFGGPERLRLVPLAFAGLAAAVAYLLGRELRLTRYTTGLLTGAAALLSPAMLIRDDLKQYTAEAFSCLLIWYLVARAENRQGWRRLIAIAVVSCAGVVVAETLLFTGVAALAALGIESVIRRRRPELVRVAVVGGCTFLVLVLEYLLIMKPHLNGSLLQYWKGYYIPASPWPAMRFVAKKLLVLAPDMGFRSLAVDAAGALAGIVALVWLRRYALAVLLPLILIIQIAGSVAGKYPFGDTRTSTFWLVLVPVLMAIAVAAIGHATRKVPVAIALAAVALAVWVPATHSYLRTHLIPNEDVRDQVAYVLAHYETGDVIVVSSQSRYGFAYYYPDPPSAYLPDTSSPVTWVPAYPDKPWIVMTKDRTSPSVAAAVATARQLAARDHGRIWIIRSHLVAGEAAAWNYYLKGGGVINTHVGGRDTLLLDYPSLQAAQAARAAWAGIKHRDPIWPAGRKP